MKIRWADRFIGNRGNVCLAYIDGKDFRTQALKRLSRKEKRKWYGHKFNAFGIKYEIATCIETGDVVHYIGPFRAAIHDVTIFRSFLKKQLHPGERVMADRGYSGDRLCFTPDDCETAQMERAVKIIGGRHETVNGRMTNFASMKLTWRHSLSLHQFAFRACLVLCQLNHQHNRPVFQVQGYNDPYVPGNDWEVETVGKCV